MEQSEKSVFTILEDERKRLSIKEMIEIEKAFKGNDVDSILKAQAYLKGIEKRESSQQKSILFDPNNINSGGGYKLKSSRLSFELLRGMSRTYIVGSVIKTRKDQVLNFCTPQADKYSTGFIIEKKKKFSLTKKEKKLTKQEEERIEDITNFILECGNVRSFWDNETFPTFITKTVFDSLSLDQATFELGRNRSNQLTRFFATDAATFRVAEMTSEDDKGEYIQGYPPSHVQVYMGNVISKYYPWELGFGVRNSSTSITSFGYGRSELEDLIQVVTGLLNADSYNGNYFKIGSSPQGIIRYSGNINHNTVEEFRKQWTAQMAGVENAHRTPIINADKLDFINTRVPNKDMEFSKYQEFLIKVICAMYSIDPSEIGFPMNGSADSKPMFEGNNEARLKYSRDKGLKPLLKSIEAWINKWIVSQLDPDYVFRFVGIETEAGEVEELDRDIKKLSNFMTVDEIRAKWNLSKIEGGELILNPTYYQAKMMAEQMKQQNQMQGQDDDYDDDEEDNNKNPFNDYNQEEGDEDWENDDENPFNKALENELPHIFA